MKFQLSELQKEFWLNANHRWNIKTGATRSGKTWLDYYIIPKRIRERSGKEGIVLLLGNTRETLERNVLSPMRDIYGSGLVGTINSQNKVKLFGDVAYALGADKITQVDKIRGSSIKYCYGDEVVTWHQDVFNMLKSRLDKEYSCFDGTCNPENPKHWFKSFLDSDVDIYQQKYTLDDNPFLPLSFVEQLKKEYLGTVYYNRYILGDWCNAEGLLFPQYANNHQHWEVVGKLPAFQMVNIGLDIGGTKSHSTLAVTGIEVGFRTICTFLEKKIVHAKGSIDTNRLCVEVVEMIKMITMMGYYPKFVFVDNAEQVILNSIRGYVKRAGYATQVLDCKKIEGKDRILIYNLLLNQDRMKFQRVPVITEALSTALYDDKKDEDTILDNFTTDIDSFDAHFYSWSYFMEYITAFR